MNPNNDDLYKMRMREIYNELNHKDYYRQNSFIVRYGRPITFGVMLMIGSSYFIKRCEGQDKNFNPKIETLEHKIRSK